jgi:hypothetical protein
VWFWPYRRVKGLNLSKPKDDAQGEWPILQSAGAAGAGGCDSWVKMGSSVHFFATFHFNDGPTLTDLPPKIQEPRLWRTDGWTARVIKNEDDDGWAVAMTRDGESEPALTGPWTMGRDKKNPKPLDGNAFGTLVKTASEFVRRSEQQLHAALHQSIRVTAGAVRVTVCLDITPDEDNPYATLSAKDEDDALLAEVRVAASFKLNRSSAVAWVEGGFKRPAR